MKLDTDYVPSGLNEAIDWLYANLEPDDIAAIKDDTATVPAMHHGLGRLLRNSWSLWDRETHLVQWCIHNLGIAHADDISGIILKGLVATVHGEPYNIYDEADYYKDYWLSQDIDPITLKKYE